MVRTTKEWEQFLGSQIRRLRLQKNMTQEELASRADVSKSTLVNLEAGQGSSLKSLIAALTVLDATAWLESLAPQVGVSPLQLVDLGKERQRARGKKRV